MEVFCPYDPRKSKPILKSELRKQQYTVTLFYCNHLAEVKSSGKCKKFGVTVQFLLCFILNLRAISEYKSPGACIWRGNLSEGFLRYEFGGLIFGGAYIWRGLFSEYYGNITL